MKTGAERFDFPVQTENAGLDSYKASFKADEAGLNTFLEDDSLQGWVGVGARRKILVLTDNQKDAAYLETAINRIGLDATVIPVTEGNWNGSLNGYDAVILNNLPRDRLSTSAQNALVSYVDRGGSLAMTGGDESFGLGGYQDSPLAAIMPVVMKPPEHKERQRALILLIDKSGSMDRDDKLKFAKAAAEKLIRTLKDNDLIAVIGFDSQPFVVIPLQTVAKSRPYFDDMVNRLAAHGKTYLLPALEQAERTVADSNAAIKHIVILTDGKVGGTIDMHYSLVSAIHHDLAPPFPLSRSVGMRISRCCRRSRATAGADIFRPIARRICRKSFCRISRTRRRCNDGGKRIHPARRKPGCRIERLRWTSAATA